MSKQTLLTQVTKGEFKAEGYNQVVILEGVALLVSDTSHCNSFPLKYPPLYQPPLYKAFTYEPISYFFNVLSSKSCKSCAHVN